jgi:type VI secretion system protein ImpL
LQPLNSVISHSGVISLDTRKKMASHAENIRARLAEIGTSLGQALPTYVLVTRPTCSPVFELFRPRPTLNRTRCSVRLTPATAPL